MASKRLILVTYLILQDVYVTYIITLFTCEKYSTNIILGGNLSQLRRKFTRIFDQKSCRHHMNQSSTIIRSFITMSFQY